MAHGVAVNVRGLHVQYGDTPVLAGLDLDVLPGERIAIIGPSGSGKSTLLACITGTRLPTSGQVHVGDVVVSSLGQAARARLRRRSMGLMFQAPDLLPELDVCENVALTMLFDGCPRAQALAAASIALAELGLARHAHKRIGELSGGEAQRVALARALVRSDVTVLVADEPTASLDRRTAERVTQLLLTRAAALGATVILATHDLSVAEACDRTVLLPQANHAASHT